ncbi:MBL fold metallo-hydrolase [Thermodesulfobacteriota bacterium]
MQIINRIHTFLWKSSSANNCNTYLIDGPIRVLIDPGHSELFDHVQQGLDALGIALEDIGLVLSTHAHPDHIEAVKLFKNKSTRFALHEEEWQFVKNIEKYISVPISIDLNSIFPDFFLNEGDISVQDIKLKVIHTPGHSPGSVSLYWAEQKLLFTGDLIFKAGLGRTDLPGGNGSLLKESIERLSKLEIEWLLPGHGDIISGAAEVRANFELLRQQWFAHI